MQICHLFLVFLEGFFCLYLIDSSEVSNMGKEKGYDVQQRFQGSYMVGAATICLPWLLFPLLVFIFNHHCIREH